VSGVNFASVTASIGGQALPVTVSNGIASASLAGRPDGMVTIDWSATDVAGNAAKATTTFRLKNQAPTITATNLFPEAPSIADFLYDVQLALIFGNPPFDLATVTVGRAGNDGFCGTADDAPAAAGYVPGYVSANSFDLSSSAKLNGTGTVAFSIFSEATSAPVTSMFCVNVSAYDTALDSVGVSRKHLSKKSFPIKLTMNPVTGSVGRVAGSVTTADGTPVPGQLVAVGLQRTNTDIRGNYHIENFPPGNIGTALGVNSPAGFSCPSVVQQIVILANRTTIVNFQNCTKQ
jgi:hypothetical protein